MDHPARDGAYLALGAAAEHLVCADLILSGYRAFQSEQMCPYDVAVDVSGRLVRVQVKGTQRLARVPQRKVETLAYIWVIRHGGAALRYTEQECDVIALVALDVRRIAYLRVDECPRTVHVRPGGPGRTFDDHPFPIN